MMLRVLRTVAVTLCLLFLNFPAGAQTSDQAQAPTPPAGTAPTTPYQGMMTSSGPLQRLSIGPGDEGDVSVFGVPDLTTHFRVAGNGTIDLPLIGKIAIAGMTADEAQATIAQKLLDGGFVKDPHVTLTIKDYTNEGIIILGEVGRPGTYSALNVRRLYDAFMAAGGLTPRAGSVVTITHKGSNTPKVVMLTTDPVKTAESNIEVLPGDTIAVSRAGIVYVVGEVQKPGGYVLEANTDNFTIMQLMAMSSGPTHLANLGHSLIIHRKADGGLVNKNIDLKKILQAKAPDVKLGAEDILWVPPSRGKLAAERGGGTILNMLTSLAIYRF